MSYRLLITGQAEQDLRDIYEYVAYTLFEPASAARIYNRIVEGLRSLSEMPGRFPLYPEKPWHTRGLRRINIGSYSAFFLTFEDSVKIIRIFYSGRDIANILGDPEIE